MRKQKTLNIALHRSSLPRDCFDIPQCLLVRGMLMLAISRKVLCKLNFRANQRDVDIANSVFRFPNTKVYTRE